MREANGLGGIAADRAMLRGIRSPEIRGVVATAVAQGWEARYQGNGHIQVKTPDGDHGFNVSMTSRGAARSYKNVRAAAKRAGLALGEGAPKKEHTAMPKGFTVDPKVMEQAGQMVHDGKTRAEVAETLGLSLDMVGAATWPEDRRVTAQTKVTTEMRELFGRRRQEGKSLAEIAEETGIGIATISKNMPPELKRPNGTGAEERKAERAAATRRHRTRKGEPPIERRYVEPVIADEPVEPDDTVGDISALVAATVVATTQEFNEYPLIRAMLGKRARYQTMLAEAEKMGDEDIALTIMAKLELPPLEEEFVKYWEATHKAERNGH